MSYFCENNTIRVSKINWLNNLLIITDADIAEMWPINQFPIIYQLIGASLAEYTGAVLGVFLGFPETPSETARAPTIRLGDQKYKELYILWLFLLAKFHAFAFEITFTAFKTT